MKLSELNPRWVVIEQTQHGMGLSFRCPHCDIRIAVWFKNPIDGSPPADITKVPNPCRWERQGDTFDTLTLTPSVDVSGHWHGHIRNGEIC